MGEAAACLVRVPTEVLKQNMQTTQSSFMPTLRTILAQKCSNPIVPSLFGGLYRGYGITLMREVPFALIQFPLYERMKVEWSVYQNVVEVSPLQAAACGSFSGAIAGALTTPLDVVKTRLILGKDR